MKQRQSIPNVEELPNGISKEVIDHIDNYASRVKKINGLTGEADKTTSIVSKELCELINELDKKGMAHSDIIDIMPFSSPNTLYYHLKDKCSHNQRTKISYDECGWMRIYAKQGAPVKTLSLLFNIAPENVSKHLTGDCSHEDGVKRVDHSTIRSNSFKDNKEISECKVCGEEFEHKSYRDRTTCSNKCNQKYMTKKSVKSRQ